LRRSASLHLKTQNLRPKGQKQRVINHLVRSLCSPMARAPNASHFWQQKKADIMTPTNKQTKGLNDDHF